MPPALPLKKTGKRKIERVGEVVPSAPFLLCPFSRKNGWELKIQNS
jgi:hypothetical protein